MSCTHAPTHANIFLCTILQTDFHLEIDIKCVKSNVGVHHDILKQTFLNINSHKTVISKNLFLAFLFNLQTYSKTKYKYCLTYFKNIAFFNHSHPPSKLL